MIGSATIGGVDCADRVLAAAGVAWAFDEIRLAGCLAFVALWLAVNLTLRVLGASDLFPAIVALIDVVLVLIVFKGDIRLT